jgi:hypothetical protein
MGGGDVFFHLFASLVEICYGKADAFELLEEVVSLINSHLGRSTYLCHMAEFTDDVTIAFDDLLLDIESQLSTRLWVIFNTAAVQKAQGIFDIRIGIGG